MSHSKERSEKICLNCNASLDGRYCHVCGQENVEPKESVWSLVSHFFNDITHFDGKFFSTLGLLIRRPGYLPREFIIGRRARYLNPIRMYIFSSAIFFLFFFSIFKADSYVMSFQNNSLTFRELPDKMAIAKRESMRLAKTAADSNRVKQDYAAVNLWIDSLVNKYNAGVGKGEVIPDGPKMINLDQREFRSKKEYDSLQSMLPDSKKDGWWRRKLVTRQLELNVRYQENPNELQKEMWEKFMHTFPYLLFVSLPLYALFLKLLYIRRKRFYYVDHAIFLIYLYIFTFIFLLVLYSLDKGRQAIGSLPLKMTVGVLEGVMLIYGIYYAYKAMRKFYEQGFFKTLLKFFLLNILAFITVMLLFGIFFILTVYNI